MLSPTTNTSPAIISGFTDQSTFTCFWSLPDNLSFIVCFVQKYGNPQTYMTSTDIFLPFHLFYSVFYSFSRKSIHYSRHVHCHVIWFAVGNAYTYFNILYDGMTFTNESYLRLSILLPFLLRYHYLLVTMFA